MICPEKAAGMRILRVLAGAILLFTAGCATQPDAPPPATRWEAYRDHAAALTEWQLSAKVALRWSGGAESASLAWSQHGGRSVVDLSGPLGAGAARITHEDGRLHVERGGEHRVYDSSTPDTLAAATGWPIPVDALRFWLRGLPDPTQALERLTLQDGRAREIRQGGWVISYAGYTAVGKGSLPTALRLNRPADDIRLRLVNGRWTTQGTGS